MSNEIILSTDINIITAEINSYKQVAGQAIFEIGRRLKHVKENDLVHGEWEKWCSESLNMTRQHARKYIRVFERFGNGTLGFHLGLNKLDLLSGFDDDELEEKIEIQDGTHKKLIEMSKKEIEEYKRQKKKRKKAKASRRGTGTGA